MDLFSNLQLLHEAAISVLVTTIYGRWRGTTTMTNTGCNIYLLFIKYIYYTVQVEFCYNVAHM